MRSDCRVLRSRPEPRPALAGGRCMHWHPRGRRSACRVLASRAGPGSLSLRARILPTSAWAPQRAAKAPVRAVPDAAVRPDALLTRSACQEAATRPAAARTGRDGPLFPGPLTPRRVGRAAIRFGARRPDEDNLDPTGAARTAIGRGNIDPGCHDSERPGCLGSV